MLLEDPEDPALPAAAAGAEGKARMKFDLCLSHLVLHHVPEVEPLLATMLGCLKPGGMVALTDFEDFGPEAKKFHARARLIGVERHGINREWITRLLEKVGFVNVSVEVGWSALKRVEKFDGEFEGAGPPREERGEMMKFPFLIMTGKRP